MIQWMAFIGFSFDFASGVRGLGPGVGYPGLFASGLMHAAHIFDLILFLFLFSPILWGTLRRHAWIMTPNSFHVLIISCDVYIVSIQ